MTLLAIIFLLIVVTPYGKALRELPSSWRNEGGVLPLWLARASCVLMVGIPAVLVALYFLA